MRWTITDISFQFPMGDGQLVEALKGVSLTIEQGERLAIVGANGSGKSTLARVLAGLLTPSSGRVTVECDSHAASQPPGEEASMAALVFQGPEDNLIAETVEQEIALALEHAGIAASDRQQMSAYLTDFGLDHMRDRPTQQLSGGEKQRLAIACAFASGRELIVLDEPTSHLDPPGRKELLSRLLGDASALANTPALVLITQYVDDARRFPRVIAMESGRVAYDGPPEQWPEPNRPKRTLRPQPIPPNERPVLVAARNLGQLAQPHWPLAGNPLSNISLEIREGDTIGLCGPIGCGKSTLAFHLAGLFDSHSGTLEVSWKNAKTDSPALMIQFPERQLFCPTVAKDVAFGPAARGGDSGEAKRLASEALNALGLLPAQFDHRSPFDLSAGQQRRVGMAGVTACRAPLYILDEPTAALDADGLERLEGILAQWRKKGIACLVISHDLEWLSHVTRRAWVMDAGRMLFDGLWSDSQQLASALNSVGFGSLPPNSSA